MRIVVCEAQVPFVEGGAEYHVRALVQQLRAHGYQTELVSVPFKWYPKDEILAHAAAWRLLDLSESNGRPIDLVIGTKFPSYFVRHPNKVAWLIHQYRAAYELCGTELQRLPPRRGGRRRCATALIDARHARCSASAGALFANAREHRGPARAVQRAARPKRCIIRPGWPTGSRPGPYGDYVLSVGRLEIGQARRPRGAGDGPRRSRRCGWSSPATARSAPTPRRWRHRSASRDRVDVPGRGRRRGADRPLCGRARRRLRALRRGLRLRDARGVSVAQARDHHDRRRRAARVRRRRRQRRRRAQPEPRGAGSRHQPPRTPIARLRGGARRRRLRPRAPTSPGTASSRIGWSGA